MKIDRTPFQMPILTSTTPKVEDNNEKQVKSQESMKEFAQNYVEQLDEALNGKGEDNVKVQQLMNKFRLGKKLSSSEMAYIKKHAPGLVNKIKEVMTKREILERSMKISKSKHQVHMATYSAVQLAKNEPTVEDKVTTTNHYADAQREYEKTDEYKEKPASPLEKEDPTKHKKSSKKRWKVEPSTVYVNIEKQKTMFESKIEHKL